MKRGYARIKFTDGKQELYEVNDIDEAVSVYPGGGFVNIMTDENNYIVFTASLIKNIEVTTVLSNGNDSEVSA